MAVNQTNFKKNTFKNEQALPEEEKKVRPEKKKPSVKNEVKEAAPKKTKEKSNKVPIWKDERYQRVLGLFFIVFAFYLLVAFTSYLFTWTSDDNLFSRTGSLLADNTIAAENWMGRMGALISYIFIKKWFGIASYLFVLMFFVSGMKLFLNIKVLPLSSTFKYSFFGVVWVSVAMGYLFRSSDYLLLGGIFGFESNKWLNGILGNIGTGIVLLFSIISLFIIALNLSFKKRVSESESDTVSTEEEAELTEPLTEPSGKNVLRNNFIPKKDTIEEDEIPEDDIEKEILSPETFEFTITEKKAEPVKENKVVIPEIIAQPEIQKEKTKKNNNIEFTIENESEPSITPEIPVAPLTAEIDIDDVAEKAKKLVSELGEYDPKLDLPSFRFPDVNLLDEYETGGSAGVQKEELEANKNRIVATLNNYAIQIEKIKATIGPTVTLYEIIPAPGVRISRIKNLEDDIALSLSALGIRIIAPIPGKGTIGIEVPNQRPEIVSMKSLISSEKFINSQYELPIALGKTISNECFVTDLTKMPHLLMAGATGQGKSVGLNAIITSLLYKKHPSQLKFILVDPKKVELTLYTKIERHYLAKLPDSEEAIITDVKKVVRTLNSLCVEMDQRYDLLRDATVRNIKEYNEKFVNRKLNPENGHRYLPYIVLVVDEFADLILNAGREIETPITRLAQLARAIGIHLIIATQRPSVNIITGTIKANFPARLAFRVISKIDSRTILDIGGADQLIGRGDMLMSTGSDLIRLQCAFVDLHEVERITAFIGEQRGYPDAFHLPEFNDDSGDEGKSIDTSDRDDLFEEAARIIVLHQQGSTSLLQRKLKLGYNRAGRIVDQLEAAGIIGPFEGSKAREVRVKDEISLEQFLKRP
jgi:DNA segregation ATPase FtsK/SpoIIIE, S-DNA-T family